MLSPWLKENPYSRRKCSIDFLGTLRYGLQEQGECLQKFCEFFCFVTLLMVLAKERELNAL